MTMKVVSVNIGERTKVQWRGKEIETGIFKRPVDTPIFLRPEGVKNDQVVDLRVHGGIDKSCYLFSADHYEYWKKQFPGLDWTYGMFGENLTVEGLDETQVKIGDIFEVGDAIVQVSQPRQPCFKLGIRFNTQTVLKEFIRKGRPGVYVRTLVEGNVRTGDTLRLTLSPDSLTVAEVFHLLYDKKVNKNQLEKVLWDSNLADSVKKDLIK